MDMIQDWMIINKIKMGDPDAWDILVHKYYDSVYFYCVRRCYGDCDIASDLTQDIFLKLVEELRQNVLEATEQNAENPKKMIEAGLMALLNTLHENPKMARIIYIDGLLVQELNNQATLQETLARFDRMIHHILMIAKPNSHRTEYEISLVASGLNGYVTQIAIRWVMNNFQQSKEDVLSACYWPFLALFNQDPDEA